MRPDGPRPSIVGPDSGPAVPFPVKVGGEVVSGFGRGSKELGIPTANIPISGLSVGGYSDIESGVYFGWAGLSPPPPSADSKTPAADGTHTPSETFAAGFEIYPMVMSIGWNPFYKNTVRSVEVHIMHKFAKDFYGAQMNLLILGFIRPEYDYVSKESLIDDINIDIEVAKKSLAREAWEKLRADEFLRSTGSEQSKG